MDTRPIFTVVRKWRKTKYNSNPVRRTEQQSRRCKTNTYRPVFISQNLCFDLRFARYSVASSMQCQQADRASTKAESKGKGSYSVSQCDCVGLYECVCMSAMGFVCGSEYCSFTVGCAHIYLCGSFIFWAASVYGYGMHVYQSYCLFSVHSLLLRSKRKTPFVSMFIWWLALVVHFQRSPASELFTLVWPSFEQYFLELFFSSAQLGRCHTFYSVFLSLGDPNNWQLEFAIYTRVNGSHLDCRASDATSELHQSEDEEEKKKTKNT